MLIARSKVLLQPGPLWFNIHVSMQYLGLLAFVAAIALAWAKFAPLSSGKLGDTGALFTAHYALGIVIVALAGLQVGWSAGASVQGDVPVLVLDDVALVHQSREMCLCLMMWCWERCVMLRCGVAPAPCLALCPILLLLVLWCSQLPCSTVLLDRVVMVAGVLATGAMHAGVHHQSCTPW